MPSASSPSSTNAFKGDKIFSFTSPHASNGGLFAAAKLANTPNNASSNTFTQCTGSNVGKDGTIVTSPAACIANSQFKAASASVTPKQFISMLSLKTPQMAKVSMDGASHGIDVSRASIGATSKCAAPGSQLSVRNLFFKPQKALEVDEKAHILFSIPPPVEQSIDTPSSLAFSAELSDEKAAPLASMILEAQTPQSLDAAVSDAHSDALDEQISREIDSLSSPKAPASTPAKNFTECVAVPIVKEAAEASKKNSVENCLLNGKAAVSVSKPQTPAKRSIETINSKSLLTPNTTKSFRLFDWFLTLVANDAAETGFKCPQWIIVEGVSEDGATLRQSSRIVDAFNRRILRSYSGSEYQLAGSMKRTKMTSKFSEKFISKFMEGFPLNWRTVLLQEMFPDAKGVSTKKYQIKAETAKKHEKQPSAPLKENPSERGESAHVSPNTSTKITRSGRISVRPLEFWNNEYRKSDVAGTLAKDVRPSRIRTSMPS